MENIKDTFQTIEEIAKKSLFSEGMVLKVMRDLYPELHLAKGTKILFTDELEELLHEEASNAILDYGYPVYHEIDRNLTWIDHKELSVLVSSILREIVKEIIPYIIKYHSDSTSK